MREVRRIEIEPDAERLGPVDPAGEVLGADLVALDELAAELAVERVQVEAMRPGDERRAPVEVGPQLVGVRALPG